MARLTEIKLIDDLDGSKADESITFSLDGVSYEIDLSKRNAAKFRSSLEPYVAAAQKLSRTRAHRVSARRRSVGTGAASRQERPRAEPSHSRMGAA